MIKLKKHIYCLILLIWVSNAQAYIDSLNLKADNTGLVNILNLSKQAAQQNNNWQELLLNPSNVTLINNLALNINTPGSAQAKAIRDYYITPELYNFIEDFPNGTGARLLTTTENASTLNLKVQDKDYVVYPNPFTNELNINYQVNETDIVTMQLIEIGSGRLLFNKILLPNDKNIKLNTENLISGIYLISFIKKGEAPVNYKLVNIK